MQHHALKDPQQQLLNPECHKNDACPRNRRSKTKKSVLDIDKAVRSNPVQGCEIILKWIPLLEFESTASRRVSCTVSSSRRIGCSNKFLVKSLTRDVEKKNNSASCLICLTHAKLYIYSTYKNLPYGQVPTRPSRLESENLMWGDACALQASRL